MLGYFYRLHGCELWDQHWRVRQSAVCEWWGVSGPHQQVQVLLPSRSVPSLSWTIWLLCLAVCQSMSVGLVSLCLLCLSACLGWLSYVCVTVSVCWSGLSALSVCLSLMICVWVSVSVSWSGHSLFALSASVCSVCLLVSDMSMCQSVSIGLISLCPLCLLVSHGQSVCVCLSVSLCHLVCLSPLSTCLWWSVCQPVSFGFPVCLLCLSVQNYHHG